MTTTTEHVAEEATMPGWGGARPGAGRPPGSGEDLVDLDTQVRRDQLDWLDRAKAIAGDRSRAVTVRRMLDEVRRVEGMREHLLTVAAEADLHGGDAATELAQAVLDILDGRDTIAPAE